MHQGRYARGYGGGAAGETGAEKEAESRKISRETEETAAGGTLKYDPTA